MIKLGAIGVNILHVAQHVVEERREKLGHVKVVIPAKEGASVNQKSHKIVINNYAQVTLS